MMKTASAKAKGRRLQDYVCKRFQDLARKLGFQAELVEPAIMGEKGADVKLYPPFSWQVARGIECKNVERLNLWQAWEQAKTHPGRPTLFVSKNRSDKLVVISADDFFELLESHLEHTEF